MLPRIEILIEKNFLIILKKSIIEKLERRACENKTKCIKAFPSRLKKDKKYKQYAYKGGIHKFGTRKSSNVIKARVWCLVKLLNNINHSFSKLTSPYKYMIGTRIKNVVKNKIAKSLSV